MAMIGSTRMRNQRSRHWWLLALTGVVCLLAFVIGRGAFTAGLAMPGVLAANTNTAHDSMQNGGDCTSGRRGPSFGGAVVVASNEVVCGNVTTFGGTLAIDGVVRGNVVAFNSDIVISGTVDGHINLYGGEVILQSGCHINGDIDLYGGRWARGDTIELQGAVNDHTKNVNWLFTGIGGFGFSFWTWLMWLALGLVLTSLLPEHVMFVRTTAVNKMRRSAVVGLLSILLAPLVLIVLTALVLSIPLAIIVGIGLIAAWGLGTISVGWQVGEYIMHKAAPHYNTRLTQIVVGLTVLILAESLPYIGLLITIGVGVWGLGAVFLSRFGTRLYGQPKRPLDL